MCNVPELNWINDGVQVDKRGGAKELETNVSENNPFDNFSYKVLYTFLLTPLVIQVYD